MRTHNICSCAEIRNILFGQPYLSVAMPFILVSDDDDDFRFNDASTHESHLRLSN